MKCYAEREPIAYFRTLKEMHQKLAVAFALRDKDEMSKLKREIALFRLQAHSTFGKGT